jgi:hypothetical protein
VAAIQAQEAKMKLNDQDGELRRLQIALQRAATASAQAPEVIGSGNNPASRRGAEDRELRSYDFNEDDNEAEEAAAALGLTARPPLKMTQSSHPAVGPSPPNARSSGDSSTSDTVEEGDHESRSDDNSGDGAESDDNEEGDGEKVDAPKRGKHTAKAPNDDSQTKTIAQLSVKLERAEARAHAAEVLASELQEQATKQTNSSNISSAKAQRGTKSSKLATTATSSSGSKSRSKGVMGSNEGAAMAALETALESERQEKQRLAAALAAAYAKEDPTAPTSQSAGEAAILGQQTAKRELESERALHEEQLKLLRAQFVR